MSDMLEDVNTGIAWVLHRIQYYGGDPANVTVVGQSCGAQLASLAITIQVRRVPFLMSTPPGGGRDVVCRHMPCCTHSTNHPKKKNQTHVLHQAEQQLLGKRLPGGAPTWDPRALRAFVGVSGVYNVHDIADYLHARGLYRPLFEQIQSLDGQPALKVLSPSYIVLDLGREYSRYAMGKLLLLKGTCVMDVCQSPSVASMYPLWAVDAHHKPTTAHGKIPYAPIPTRLLPPVVLLHGSDDRCVPSRYAEQFAEALSSIGARVELKMYKAETHTSPLIENPLRGGRDMLQDDILRIVLGRDVRTNHPAMCPALLISLAARVNPF